MFDLFSPLQNLRVDLPTKAPVSATWHSNQRVFIIIIINLKYNCFSVIPEKGSPPLAKCSVGILSLASGIELRKVAKRFQGS